MRRKDPTPQALEEDSRLHIVARLAIADPAVIAQNLVYEAAHGETEILEALAKLLEANRNESGKNLASYVTTANLSVNRISEYIFDECQFARQICSHLSREQIDSLLEYNNAKLENPKPSKEIELVREVFGPPEIIKPGEGNSYLKTFLSTGKQFASADPLKVPEVKPPVKAVKASNMAVCMLSMCISRGFSPLRRHDGSHVNSGFNNTVAGEIFNQTHDLGQNSLAQYRLVPTMQEQVQNRKMIYSFEGLPQNVKSLKRDWKKYVDEALETWRMFLVEHPEYIEKWKLTGLVDDQMRMIKPDGSPIISTQTGKHQIPVIDYTDLAILRHLEKPINRLLTDEEVYGAMPHDTLYFHMLQSVDLLGREYILRDGKPEVMHNGMLDSCETYRNVSWGHFEGWPQLSDLSSPKLDAMYQKEIAAMEKQRAEAEKQGKWCGYMVDIGQNHGKKMWVTEKPPALSLIYPKSLTVHRVTVPKECLTTKTCPDHLFSGVASLVDSNAIKIESTLSIRDDTHIPDIQPNRARRFAAKPSPRIPTIKPTYGEEVLSVGKNASDFYVPRR